MSSGKHEGVCTLGHGRFYGTRSLQLVCVCVRAQHATVLNCERIKSVFIVECCILKPNPATGSNNRSEGIKYKLHTVFKLIPQSFYVHI